MSLNNNVLMELIWRYKHYAWSSEGRRLEIAEIISIVRCIESKSELSFLNVYSAVNLSTQNFEDGWIWRTVKLFNTEYRLWVESLMYDRLLLVPAIPPPLQIQFRNFFHPKNYSYLMDIFIFQAFLFGMFVSGGVFLFFAILSKVI